MDSRGTGCKAREEARLVRCAPGRPSSRAVKAPALEAQRSSGKKKSVRATPRVTTHASIRNRSKSRFLHITPRRSSSGSNSPRPSRATARAALFFFAPSALPITMREPLALALLGSRDRNSPPAHSTISQTVSLGGMPSVPGRTKTAYGARTTCRRRPRPPARSRLRAPLRTRGREGCTPPR